MNQPNENDIAAITAAADPSAADGYLDTQRPSLHLAPEHYRDLTRTSGLNAATIDLMRVKSVRPADISRITSNRGVESILEFPYSTFDGKPFSRYKLFPPQKDSTGHKQKYHQLPDTGCHLYFLEPVRKLFTDPRIPLGLVEGEKKCAAAFQHGLNGICVAGVWSWCKSDTGELIDDFKHIAWADRSIELIFDSNIWVREDLQRGVYALGKLLEAKGGKFSVVVIPGAPDGASVGFDDFVIAKGFAAFKVLSRIDLKHPSLNQHSDWFKRWREKRKRETKESAKSSLQLQDVVPWTEQVNGDSLIHEICETHRRFVDATSAQSIAIALWCIHAHAIEHFDISPFLVMTSATMRSGKTTTIQVIERLVPKPLLASNISSAALYRAIEACKPTVVLDEFEYIIESIPELRGILNSSHSRRTAYVLRSDGDDYEPRMFSTWCPKCFGLIGKMPPTATDRSIEIRMRRKVQSVKKESFKLAKNYEDIEVIRRKIARWVKDNANAIRAANPPALDQLDDRANDNWNPLFKIASVIGDEWLGRAQTAALEINQIKADDSTAIQLLSDIRTIISDVDKVTSKALVEELTSLEDRPWATYNRGKPISYRQVAKVLQAFDIPTNRTVRLGDDTAKGFESAWFQDAFARYLSADSDSNRSQQSQCSQTNNLDGIFDQSQNQTVTDEKIDLTPGKNGVVTDVTDEQPNTGWEEL